MIQGCRRLNEAGNDGRRRRLILPKHRSIPYIFNIAHESNVSEIRKMYKPPKGKYFYNQETNRIDRA